VRKAEVPATCSLRWHAPAHALRFAPGAQQSSAAADVAQHTKSAHRAAPIGAQHARHARRCIGPGAAGRDGQARGQALSMFEQGNRCSSRIELPVVAPARETRQSYRAEGMELQQVLLAHCTAVSSRATSGPSASARSFPRTRPPARHAGQRNLG